ncbi:endo-1,4-beta-xylanase [Segatella copri]|jgi:GH35 family endo-1,4-beta-xylanase|uniref:Beta-xylanase n=1 Tax=Segatella copri TaxID=165179 RepID=A0A414TDT5_9BACT|nr:endo-1,4-beta-xylanase [Segatella copri]RHG32359.1 glycosyl hydrolase family 10 [Segatella copri]RHG32468.1 glycosyl hydrolase family 10 [Segatella copri]RHG63183.1 glycosyl hydrolase family 10 [Segatella copri]
MKVNKYIISALVCPFVLGSCADWDDWKYDVEKPQTIAQYEYLNDYAPLKEYLDRGAHPGFKVSAALGVDEFNQQGPLFRLAAHNFDEIVAGNAMKMASCVNDQGVMDFSKVSSFVRAAEDAGLTVYGHTLAWHAQQPRKWLEKLIADKELDVDPDQKTFTELSRQTYQDGKFPFYEMGCAPDIINGSIHFVPTGDWSQFFCMTGCSMKAGNYVAILHIKSTKDGMISLTAQNGWGAEAQKITQKFTVKANEWVDAEVALNDIQGGNYDFILLPETFDGTLDLQSVTIGQYESPAMEVEQEVKHQTYQDGPFPYYQMGCAPDVINGSIHFVPTGDWSQFFCVTGAPLTPGNYAVDVEIKSTKSGNIKMTVQNGWGGDAESRDGTVALKEGWTTARFKMTLEQGGNYDFILKPETFDATLDLKSVTIKKIVKTNSIPLTPQEKSDTLTWAMNKWISGMMQATEGKVKAWDLINEAVSGGGNVNGFYALQTEATSEHNPQDFYWQDYFTPEMYGPIVEKAARDAYAAVEGTNPEDLKLFINDYNLESDWDDNKKVKSLKYWIEVWEKKGKELGWNTKIDGIGSQMHISYYENPQTLESKKKAIQNMLKIMAETGKLVRISEIDMGYVDKDGKDVTTAQLEKLPIEERVAKEKAMAEHYKWIIEQYFKIVPVSQQYGICQWCLTDSPTDSGWRPGQPVGLWNLNYQRKPAYGGFADGLASSAKGESDVK